MGKSTISMAIFNCYVSSPEGNRTGFFVWATTASNPATQLRQLQSCHPWRAVTLPESLLHKSGRKFAERKKPMRVDVQDGLWERHIFSHQNHQVSLQCSEYTSALCGASGARRLGDAIFAEKGFPLRPVRIIRKSHRNILPGRRAICFVRMEIAFWNHQPICLYICLLICIDL